MNGTPAWRCEVCGKIPKWSTERWGDAVVSWACDAHLSEVCARLQRDWETTRVVIRLFAKAALMPTSRGVGHAR